MRNQCSGLFTCIMNYLHVLCMIFMVLSCVLYMTLMVSIYVYYGIFSCTNLVDVMSLFFTVFCSIYRFLTKIGRFPAQTAWKSSTGFLNNRAIYRCSRFHYSSIISDAFRSNFPIFLKTDGIGDVRFSWFCRIFEH
jgi:hypothetical protein